MTVPLPSELTVPGKSKDGLGRVCASCERRIHGFFKMLREQAESAGPIRRSHTATLPPGHLEALDWPQRKEAVRASEVERLRASAPETSDFDPNMPRTSKAVLTSTMDSTAAGSSDGMCMSDPQCATNAASAAVQPSASAEPAAASASAATAERAVLAEPAAMAPRPARSKKPWGSMSEEELLPLLREERALYCRIFLTNRDRWSKEPSGEAFLDGHMERVGVE